MQVEWGEEMRKDDKEGEKEITRRARTNTHKNMNEEKNNNRNMKDHKYDLFCPLSEVYEVGTFQKPSRL